MEKIRETIDKTKRFLQYLKEGDINEMVKTYHGVPFKKSAESIKRTGLRQVGDFIPVGGVGAPSITKRSYITKELWNAVRYSFMKPYPNMEWDDFIKKEPYGFVFEFNSSINELLPDEDAIGQKTSDYLNKNENDYLEKYLKNINQDLIQKVKETDFEAYAEIGKIIEPNLTNEDKLRIVKDSATATVDKPIFPTKSYMIKKPNVQFFKIKNEYIEWFNKNSKIF